MAKSKQEIIDDLKAYMKEWGGTWGSWYVGITADPRTRLFVEHKVNERSGRWIYRQAASNLIAREIEQYFINTLRTDGGPGGGDATARHVYSYKKTIGTKP
jgi:hypothetical protein